jgi:hypothetical protein
MTSGLPSRPKIAFSAGEATENKFIVSASALIAIECKETEFVNACVEAGDPVTCPNSSFHAQLERSALVVPFDCPAQFRAAGSAGRTIHNSRSSSPIECARPIKRDGRSVANEVRKVARSEVTQLPWGEWLQPTAFRKNVRGVLHFWRLDFLERASGVASMGELPCILKC